MSGGPGIIVPERPIVPGLRKLLEAGTARPWAESTSYGAVVNPEGTNGDREDDKAYGGKVIFESCDRVNRELILATFNDYLPALLAFLDAYHVRREYLTKGHFGHPGEDEILQRALNEAWAKLVELP